jgi:hypothetical protein
MIFGKDILGTPGTFACIRARLVLRGDTDRRLCHHRNAPPHRVFALGRFPDCCVPLCFARSSPAKDSRPPVVMSVASSSSSTPSSSAGTSPVALNGAESVVVVQAPTPTASPPQPSSLPALVARLKLEPSPANALQSPTAQALSQASSPGLSAHGQAHYHDSPDHHSTDDKSTTVSSVPTGLTEFEQCNLFVGDLARNCGEVCIMPPLASSASVGLLPSILLPLSMIQTDVVVYNV